MKKMLLGLVLAIAPLCVPLLRAEAPPLFSPEPPDAAAAALVEAYLPLLAAGQFEQALALNDLRGMRQYLLDRRLGDLKTKNPELTAQEMEEISAQLQLNDLNPGRLQEILLGVMKESSYSGMTWRVQGFAPGPEATGGYLASVDARTAEGKEKPILIGLKKLGEQWMVAPEIIEELGRKVVVPGGANLPPPDEVAAAVDAFWKQWQTGALNEAYGMFGEEYRKHVPLLVFLQQAQEFIAQIGSPISWNVVRCRPLAPATLGLGVNVQGSTALKPTIMIFQKTGQTWVLMDSQFRMPPPQSPPPAAGPAASRPLQSDLRPQLQSAPEPAPSSPSEPPVSGANSAPAAPAAPIGPDAQ